MGKYIFGGSRVDGSLQARCHRLGERFNRAGLLRRVSVWLKQSLISLSLHGEGKQAYFLIR